MTSVKKVLAAVIALVTVAVFAACTTADSAADISIEGAWARPADVEAALPMTPTPGMLMDAASMPEMNMSGVNTAAYMVLVNGGDTADALIGATSDVAESTELHESSIVDGVMQMSPIEEVVVPADGQAGQKRGGMHVMMVGLRQSLAPGDKVILTLHFRDSGDVTAVAEVRPP